MSDLRCVTWRLRIQGSQFSTQCVETRTYAIVSSLAIQRVHKHIVPSLFYPRDRNSTVLDTRGRTRTGVKRHRCRSLFIIHMPLIFKARVEVGSVPLTSAPFTELASLIALFPQLRYSCVWLVSV